MTSSRRTLERIGDRVPVPEPAYERLLRRRDRKRRNDRIVGLTVGLLVIAIMGGAVLLGSHVGTRTLPSGPTVSPTRLPGPISHELLSGLDRRLQPGPYWLSRGDLFISFQVPAGWRSFGDLAVSGPDRAAVGFWFADRAPIDPCNWQGASRDPGASVDGLAAALGDQPGTTASVDVTLAGYPGRSMRLQAPTDVSMSGVDFKDCDVTIVHSRRFEHVYIRWWMGDSWFGERPDQIDRIWILDVHGERLLVVASWFPSTSQRTRTQIAGIVDSIRIS